jgi:sugar lactone lactonase YvrE
VRTFGEAQPLERVVARLGEGPRWDAERSRLLWVDIEAGALHVVGSEERTIECGSKVGAAAPWTDDTVLVALADAIAAVDLRDGAVQRLTAFPDARPGMRSNDGACDPLGRFWIGTMDENNERGAGTLYRYDPDGSLHPMVEDVTLSNGLGWDPEARLMYYVDSTTQRIDVFDFDLRAGSIANRRVFAEIPKAEGTPDGLAVDDDGGIWVALWRAGEVRRYTPDGNPDGRVAVPADNTTACCFKGSRLIITTASIEMKPDRAAAQPMAGCLFEIEVPFSGPPATPFAGVTKGV